MKTAANIYIFAAEMGVYLRQRRWNEVCIMGTVGPVWESP